MADHLATDEPDEPGEARHEPVLDEARTAAAYASLAPLISGVLVVTGLASRTEATALEVAGSGIAAGVVVVLNFVIARWRARKARAVVTPNAAPRTLDGEQLVTLATARRLAAAEQARVVVHEGKPEASPWDEDDTIVRDAP